MSEQRMTTLISKAPFLPSALKNLAQKNLAKAETEIRRWLQDRGLPISPADLAALIENVSPAASQGVLSYALDFIRPLALGMGLKIARLSDTQVEVSIPFRLKNQTENHEMDESVCTVAAIEAARNLWRRHAPMGNLEIRVLEMRFKKHRLIQESCRARMELSEALREKVLAQLRRQRVSECENNIALFDDKDQKVAEISARLELKWTPALNSTKD